MTRYPIGMPELIPELRADRNGKLVTRHVKASVSANAVIPEVPRVDSSDNDFWKLRKELAKKLDVPIFSLDENLRQPHRLRALMELASRHELSASSNSLIESLTAMHNDDDFMRCVELLDRHFDAACRELTATTSSRAAMYAMGLVTGLNLMKFDMTQEQERLLVESGCRIWMGDIIRKHGLQALNEVFPKRGEEEDQRCVGATAIREDLARYLIENAEKAEIIIEVITQRGISDPKLLDGLVDEFSTAAVPLTEGVL